MRNQLKMVVAILVCCCISNLSAQNVAITKDGASADASAILDLQSNNQGFLTPRMTTSQRTSISTPANGLIVFDTDDDVFYFYQVNTWVELGALTAFADNDDDTKIDVEATSDIDEIQFKAGGADVMVITDGGRVGINNSAPQGMLHLKPIPPTGSGTANQVQALSSFATSGTNFGQSFVPSVTGLIDKITFNANTGSAPATSGTLNIYEGEGTTGNPIIHSETFSTGSGSTKTISVANASVTANTTYTFQLLFNSSFTITAREGNSYGSGKFYKNDALYNNSTPNDNDMKFSIYILAAPAQNEVIVTTDGLVGIGTTNPTYDLHVNGTVAGVGAYNELSDRRYKKNIQALESSLTKLKQVQGVRYDWRQEDFPNIKFMEGSTMGFIAQDLKEIFPEVVNQDKNGFYTVEYSGMVPVLVEALKEMELRLAEKEAEITALQIAQLANTQALTEIQAKLATTADTLPIEAAATGRE